MRLNQPVRDTVFAVCEAVSLKYVPDPDVLDKFYPARTIALQCDLDGSFQTINPDEMPCYFCATLPAAESNDTETVAAGDFAADGAGLYKVTRHPPAAARKIPSRKGRGSLLRPP